MEILKEDIVLAELLAVKVPRNYKLPDNVHIVLKHEKSIFLDFNIKVPEVFLVKKENWTLCTNITGLDTDVGNLL